MRAARTDANHIEIVKALRAIGASVQSLAAVGVGCPDLLVGYRGANYLLEIKDGTKVPSAQKLTPMQIDWHSSWNGRVAIVNSVDGAIAVVSRF